MDMLIIVILIVITLVLYILFAYNSLTKRKLRVNQAESGIEIYLTQRFELIPNLVTCVKAYCEHEERIFTEIAETRENYLKNKSLQTGEQLNEKYYSLMTLTENYPNLKASEQFLNLQKNLVKIESQLQAARRIYNSEVTKLNISIDTFPNNLIAKVFNIEKANLFEADINDKNNVKMELNRE